MKKKILFIAIMAVMLAFVLALCVGARTNYREEQTYNYYDESGNLLYTATTIYAVDRDNNGKYRFEGTLREGEINFAKVDESGNPLTWFVVSDDKDSDGDCVQNITVASVKTATIGTIDANGLFTFNNTVVNGVTVKADNIVSINFFGMDIKSFPNAMFRADAVSAPNGSTKEYCQMTNGAYLVALYLPKTLTAIPDAFCQRSPVRVVEFEDNMISGSCAIATKTINDSKGQAIEGGPFAYCANLRAITIPEGVTSVATKSFRECLSIAYFKFPSTVTRLETDVIWRGGLFLHTVVLGENMTYAAPINNVFARFWFGESSNENIHMKYMYIPNTINTAGKFDSYRGTNDNNAKGYVDVEKSVVFFFAGTLEEAKKIAGYTDRHFTSAVNGLTSAKNSTTPGEKPVDYDTYLANKEYYDNLPTNMHLLVYNVPKCVAFYDEEHVYEEGKVNFVDALSPVTITDGCTRCGDANVTEYKPLLTYLGYSAQIGGDKISFGYYVNLDTLKLVPHIKYGVLAAVPGANDDINAFEPLNPDITLTDGRTNAFFMEIESVYGGFDLIISDFQNNTEHYETPIAMCAFVTDGESIDYICLDEVNNIVQSDYAIPTTFKAVAESNLAKYRVNFSCDSTMGTLSGETSQVVTEGNESTEVTATAKQGYTFACWSDGTKSATITVNPEKDVDLVACFTPNSTGLPVMTINTEGGAAINTKEYYINCEITVLDTETGKNVGAAVAEIKGRGNSTWNLAKKPYKFKFDKKQDLFGFGKEKTWVLLADHRDFTLLRNMSAFGVAQVFSELGTSSLAQSVELYVNGQYAGVYLLCEQTQIKENRVNVTEEDSELEQGPKDLGYLVEMDGWAIANGSSTPNLTTEGDIYVSVPDALNSKRRYAVKDPEDIFYDAEGNLIPYASNPYLQYVQEYLRAAIAAAQGDDYDAACQLIDVKSFAQAYIVFEIFKNPDTNYSSVYFYWDKDGKLICGPVWDFDMALGNVSHKDKQGITDAFSDPTVLWSNTQNPWFKGLLKFKEFQKLVLDELLANKDAIAEAFDACIAYANEHAESYKKNFEDKWDVIGDSLFSIPDYLKEIKTWEGQVEFMVDYFYESLNGLVEYYTNLVNTAE